MEQWQSVQKKYPARLLAIENPEAARLLQYLLESSGYRVVCDPAELPGADFLLVPPGGAPKRAEGLEYMLLENSGRMTESSSCPFRYHAVEYETALRVFPPGCCRERSGSAIPYTAPKRTFSPGISAQADMGSCLSWKAAESWGVSRSARSGKSARPLWRPLRQSAVGFRLRG